MGAEPVVRFCSRQRVLMFLDRMATNKIVTVAIITVLVILIIAVVVSKFR